MIANHPSWESSARLDSAHDAPAGDDATPSATKPSEHHSPSIGEAIVARMKGSPWAIVITSVSLGVLAGCLVKRR